MAFYFIASCQSSDTFPKNSIPQSAYIDVVVIIVVIIVIVVIVVVIAVGVGSKDTCQRYWGSKEVEEGEAWYGSWRITQWLRFNLIRIGHRICLLLLGGIYSWNCDLCYEKQSHNLQWKWFCLNQNRRAAHSKMGGGWCTQIKNHFNSNLAVIKALFHGGETNPHSIYSLQCGFLSSWLAYSMISSRCRVFDERYWFTTKTSSHSKL